MGVDSTAYIEGGAAHMANAEFDELLKDLPHYWGNRDGFIQRSDYIERVRNSSLTADQVARLRDSLVQGQPGTPTGQKLETIRSMLHGVYELKIREEERASESRLISFFRNHPVGAVLAFVIGAVITALIVLVVGVVFSDPISHWWQRIR